jgi:hypothetical protein
MQVPEQAYIYDMKQDFNFLGLCLAEIEQQVGWGESTTWTQQDFEELSEQICVKTGVRLSVTTLKRIWGKVAYNSSPTNHTLNTLAIFCGYESWRDFKLKHTPADDAANMALPQGGEAHQAPVILEPATQRKQRVFKASYSLLIPVLVIMAGLLFYGLMAKPFSIDASKISFSSQPVTQGLPNTVIFNYDVSASPYEDIAIQQSWDERMREKVSKEGRQYTTTYYYPGYHRAKLLINNKVIKEHDVYIKTNGWLALLETDDIPLYIKDKIIDKGIMQAPFASLEKFQLASTRQVPWVDYYNVQDFGNLSSNDFTFETELRNETNTANAICQESRIAIMCSDGRLLIPLTIPGCVGNINLHLSDLYIEGRKNDLSAFGCNLSGWQKLRCEVKKKQLTVFLNDKEIFRTTYTHDAGKIIGIRYKFMGAGAVNYVKLWDKNKKIIFEDNFE